MLQLAMQDVQGGRGQLVGRHSGQGLQSREAHRQRCASVEEGEQERTLGGQRKRKVLGEHIQGVGVVVQGLCSAGAVLSCRASIGCCHAPAVAGVLPGVVVCHTARVVWGVEVEAVGGAQDTLVVRVHHHGRVQAGHLLRVGVLGKVCRVAQHARVCRDKELGHVQVEVRHTGVRGLGQGGPILGTQRPVADCRVHRHASGVHLFQVAGSVRFVLGSLWRHPRAVTGGERILQLLFSGLEGDGGGGHLCRQQLLLREGVHLAQGEDCRGGQLHLALCEAAKDERDKRRVPAVTHGLHDGLHVLGQSELSVGEAVPQQHGAKARADGRAVVGAASSAAQVSTSCVGGSHMRGHATRLGGSGNLGQGTACMLHHPGLRQVVVGHGVEEELLCDVIPHIGHAGVGVHLLHLVLLALQAACVGDDLLLGVQGHAAPVERCLSHGGPVCVLQHAGEVLCRSCFGVQVGDDVQCPRPQGGVGVARVRPCEGGRGLGGRGGCFLDLVCHACGGEQRLQGQTRVASRADNARDGLCQLQGGVLHRGADRDDVTHVLQRVGVVRHTAGGDVFGVLRRLPALGSCRGHFSLRLLHGPCHSVKVVPERIHFRGSGHEGDQQVASAGHAPRGSVAHSHDEHTSVHAQSGAQRHVCVGCGGQPGRGGVGAVLCIGPLPVPCGRVLRSGSAIHGFRVHQVPPSEGCLCGVALGVPVCCVGRALVQAVTRVRPGGAVGVGQTRHGASVHTRRDGRHGLQILDQERAHGGCGLAARLGVVCGKAGNGTTTAHSVGVQQRASHGCEEVWLHHQLLGDGRCAGGVLAVQGALQQSVQCLALSVSGRHGLRRHFFVSVAALFRVADDGDVSAFPGCQGGRVHLLAAQALAVREYGGAAVGCSVQEVGVDSLAAAHRVIRLRGLAWGEWQGRHGQARLGEL